MCGGRRRSGSRRIAIGVVRQGTNEHAERHLERLRGINLLAVRLDLGDDQILRFGSNHIQVQCATRHGLAVNRRRRGRDDQPACSFGRQTETVGMAEAVLLRHPAVENKRGRSIMRLIAIGDDVEIPAQRRQIRGLRTLHVANLDDVVDAFADKDLAGTRLDRDFRIVVAPGVRGKKEERQARQVRSSKSGYIASPILLHGDPAEHTDLHLSVSLALFLLPFAHLAQGVFDPITRDLRLGCFCSCFCSSDLPGSSFFFCSCSFFCCSFFC